MALPDYFQRNAVAASQAITGLDEERLSQKLENVRVGITIGRDAQGPEGKALSDLLVRLVARLYPSVTVRSEGKTGPANDAMELASRINPRVESPRSPTVEIVLGETRLKRQTTSRIYVGSNGWTGLVSSRRAQGCGTSDVPFGAGAAACLAAANLFRQVFLPAPHLDRDARLSTLGIDGPEHLEVRGRLGDVVLAGAGAIGNSVAWALARTSMEGSLNIVDKETIDLGNLQRYALALRSDEGAPKVEVAARYIDGSLAARTHLSDIATYLAGRHHQVHRLLLALDSARDRRAAQASLPRWIANGWTQPGDLGVSTHDFLMGACVCCLYLPDQPVKNEDSLIAEAFGVPDRLTQVRTLLHKNIGAPRDLLEAIAGAKGIALDRLLPFEGHLLRRLYADGFCGGALIPLANVGTPPADVHVPLAHQSALAGVLLAAAAVRHALGPYQASHITQLDVLKPLPEQPTRPAAKHPNGRCICQDQDYREVYSRKYQSVGGNA